MLPNIHDLHIGLCAICWVAILQRLAVGMIDIDRAIGYLKAQINT